MTAPTSWKRVRHQLAHGLRPGPDQRSARVPGSGVRAGKAGALFGATGVVGLLAAILLSFALAYGLAEALENVWLGFLIVGVLYLAVAGLLFVQGRRKVAGFPPVANQTLQTVKQDVEVAKVSISRGASNGP